MASCTGCSGPLVKHVTPVDNYNCDQCKTTGLPAGSVLWGCHEGKCDFDMCEGCYQGGGDLSANGKLLRAAEAGRCDEAIQLLKDGAEAHHQQDSDGKSVMMAAAANGDGPLVAELLSAGAPWNAVDRVGHCAGQYALKHGHQAVVNQLVDAGVLAEMLLGVVQRKTQRAQNARFAGTGREGKEDYLDRQVKYDGDSLIDSDNDAVMMEWERPLMDAHAEIICEGQGDVLNVGFGMGIVDNAIQLRKPRSHTIIEAHPDVYKKMLADGWDKKPGVRIIFGRWEVSDATIDYYSLDFYRLDCCSDSPKLSYQI
jgi:protein arginine N-methyltransferase 2